MRGLDRSSSRDVERHARARRPPPRAISSAVAAAPRRRVRAAAHDVAPRAARASARCARPMPRDAPGDERDLARRASAPSSRLHDSRSGRVDSRGIRRRTATRASLRMRRDEPRQHLAGPDLDEACRCPSPSHALDLLLPAHRRGHLPHERVARAAPRRDRAPRRRSCTPGIAGSANGVAREHRRETLGRGLHQRAVERRAHRERDRALGARGQRALGRRAPRPPAWPAITICPGALKFAGATTSPARRLGAEPLERRRARGRGSRPSRPTPSGTASCMNRPRCAHRSAPRRRTRASRPRRAPSTRRGCGPAAAAGAAPPRRERAQAAIDDGEDRRLRDLGARELGLAPSKQSARQREAQRRVRLARRRRGRGLGRLRQSPAPSPGAASPARERAAGVTASPAHHARPPRSGRRRRRPSGRRPRAAPAPRAPPRRARSGSRPPRCSRSGRC